MSKHFSDSNVSANHSITYKLGAPVSTVCVAATFTSVTYADNGGKVQLVSAGVHGLTTSPAVDASVYVSWASGTGVSGLYTVLSVDSTVAFTINETYVVGIGTPTVAVANTLILIPVCTIPPLQANSFLNVTAGFYFTASANYKSVFAILKSTSFCTSQTNGVTTKLMRLDGWIKNINSTEIQKGSWLTTPSGYHTATDFKTGAVNTSVGNTFYIGLQPAAANEFITLSACVVEVFI